MFFLREPDSNSDRKRRKPIPDSLRHELILRCKGRCELCGLDFYKAGITPEIHHKDGNPRNNKPSNLIVLCPNCHTKVQRALEKTKKTERRRSKRKEVSPLDVLKEVEDSILDRLEDIDRKFSDLF
jgi:5-methylcytosine-specific restriction endonuclease McrA